MAHGKDAIIKLDNTSGTLTDITALCDTVDGLPGGVDQHDNTPFGKEDHTFESGLGNAKVTLGGPWSATLHAVFGTKTQWKAGTRSIEFGPAGTTSGNVKITAECNIEDYKVPTKSTDLNRWSATLQITDAVTDGTYP